MLKLDRVMISDLIEQLSQHSNIDNSRITETRIYEKHKNNSACFVVREKHIIGCVFLWNSSSRDDDCSYIEVGTVWIHPQIGISQGEHPTF